MSESRITSQSDEEKRLRLALARLDKARANASDPWRRHMESVEEAESEAQCAAREFAEALK